MDHGQNGAKNEQNNKKRSINNNNYYKSNKMKILYIEKFFLIFTLKIKNIFYMDSFGFGIILYKFDTFFLNSLYK